MTVTMHSLGKSSRAKERVKTCMDNCCKNMTGLSSEVIIIAGTAGALVTVKTAVITVEANLMSRSFQKLNLSVKIATVPSLSAALNDDDSLIHRCITCHYRSDYSNLIEPEGEGTSNLIFLWRRQWTGWSIGSRSWSEQQYRTKRSGTCCLLQRRQIMTRLRNPILSVQGSLENRYQRSS